MTPREQRELAKATAKATAANLHVVVGRVKATGQEVFAVNSQSRANLWHLLTVVDGHLMCDCEAGKRGRICCHRAAVHEYLLAGYRAALRATVTHDTAPVVRRQTRISMFKE